MRVRAVQVKNYGIQKTSIVKDRHSCKFGIYAINNALTPAHMKNNGHIQLPRVSDVKVYLAVYSSVVLVNYN